MKKLLDAASKAYYEGTPIMTDTEFDILADQCGYEDVGYAGDFEASHLYPMYSLQKVYEGDKSPFDESEDVLVTPKLDGAAVSLGYFDGELVIALTRGNGKKGRIITDKLKWLVPNQISLKGSVQITGEVVCPKTIPNARNYASGSLNLKSSKDFQMRRHQLRFVAYDIQPGCENLWTEDMEFINRCGFDTVLQEDWRNYPQDGLVFRINSRAKYESLGYTSHHPRGAFAFKSRPAGVVTKLLDVVWQVGKTGVVSPVAILDPVLVGEATVSRATLHNIKYIKELDLEIGCDVEIIRSGEIIPRVVRRVK
jgi:DNA ligase (NAD+)